MPNKLDSLNYNEAAARLGVSRRTFNRLLIRYRDTLRPLVFNHRLRRVRASMLARLEQRFNREAEERGLRGKE
jgi:predicted DNA-binding protein (UPF0251 family)